MDVFMFDKEFENLKSKCQHKAVHLARKYAYDIYDEVDDILQESAIRMFKACSSDGNITDRMTWTYYRAAITSVGVDRWRHHECCPENPCGVLEDGYDLPPKYGDQVVVYDSYPVLDQEVIDQEVNDLLSSISNERWRKAVVARYIEGRPYEEASEVFGIPVGTVKSQAFRGLEQIRKGVGLDPHLGASTGLKQIRATLEEG